ncbi:probable G-protein coupled receptor Mth-like 5 isoform X1 [Bacillus rossius redtenbacheri]|uniref:probable G-protein coupled receptor Mth-like 5 isoform X1 n=1 Tax=Bacillus rossius redtenbacheri TaxID=93214 RepID=UPI002FDCD5F1
MYLRVLAVSFLCMRMIEVAAQGVVRVQKCCERFELMIDNRCAHKNESDSEVWNPVFSSESGQDNVQVPLFRLVIGQPECGARLKWPIFHYPGSQDRLSLLPNGKLRHFISHHEHDSKGADVELSQLSGGDLDGQRYHDYDLGLYCLDKSQEAGQVAQYALVCSPDAGPSWNDSDHLVRTVVDPACRGVALACYVAVAAVYFVLPQLRDLAGNVVSSLAACLAVSQAAGLVLVFVQFRHHVSFLVADTFMYVGLLASFYWLNSLGYYIWRTFRSRNVYLRVTDGRKYCYYSLYVWCCTLSMAAVALFAHFMLEPEGIKTQPGVLMQNNLGWLGVAMFFTPVAFTILVNLFFYLTTGQIINRMSTYGRIHHKMKYSFEMFAKLFLVMVVGWLFLLLSWMRYSVLFYCNVLVNVLQALLVLYVCVLGQGRVTALARASCCPCGRKGAEPGADWGEEMSSMNPCSY